MVNERCSSVAKEVIQGSEEEEVFQSSSRNCQSQPQLKVLKKALC